MRKAEIRFVQVVYNEAPDILETTLLANHIPSKKVHYLKYHKDEDKERYKDLIESNYHSLKD